MLPRSILSGAAASAPLRLLLRSRRMRPMTTHIALQRVASFDCTPHPSATATNDAAFAQETLRSAQDACSVREVISLRTPKRRHPPTAATNDLASAQDARPGARLSPESLVCTALLRFKAVHSRICAPHFLPRPNRAEERSLVGDLGRLEKPRQTKNYPRTRRLAFVCPLIYNRNSLRWRRSPFPHE